MTDFNFLQDILILLGLALLITFFCSRIKLSPIIGYLITGLLVGPYGFHLIKGIDEVEVMAEVGVIMLLFTIGLEFSVSRIIRLKGLLLKSGTTQVVLTCLLVYGLVSLVGLPGKTAWALGMAMALSSTAIVLKLLQERGELDSAHGRIALAMLLFQDLGVIFFLVALPMLGGEAKDYSLLGVAEATGLLIGLYAFSRYLLQPLLIRVLRTRVSELFRLTILFLVLGTAWITHLAGLSLALGAFLAGLALAESDYSHQVLSDIIPFRDTFLAVFFISMGMLVNVRSFSGEWPLIIGLFLLLCILKAVVASLAALWSHYPLRIALLSGLILFQVGEFSFILLKQALALQLVSEHVYQVTLFIIALSMMVTPLIFSRAGAMASRLAVLLGQRNDSWTDEEGERLADMEGHVVIAGYGLVGRNVAQVLREVRIPYVHIEMNGEIVRRARESGESIVYGDATSATVLEGVSTDRAQALVLAINDPSALARTIQAAREINKSLYILVRTRFVLELEPLYELGADEVIPEEFEASLQMAACLLRSFSVPEGKTLKLLSSLRQENYSELRDPVVPPADLARYLSVLKGGQIEFLSLPDTSPCLGLNLTELQFRSRTDTMVVGVVRREQILYNPTAELCLEEGDTLMLLGDVENIDRARKMLHGNSQIN